MRYLISFFIAQSVFALSCEAIKFNHEFISSVDHLVQGEPISKKAKEKTKEQTMNVHVDYEFRVDKDFKGDLKGKTIKIITNDYWGPMLVLNSPYVLALQKKEGQFHLSPCAFHRQVKHLQDKDLQVIKSYKP
jgi:hypothetical protein